MSDASDSMRKRCKKNDMIRDAGLQTPESICRSDNIPYGPDPRWNVLDVYRRKDLSGTAPVIVSVHGGGWVYGDKETYQYYAMGLAERGFAVVNFTYRLAPEYRFPLQEEDINSVIGWVLSHGTEYGFDTENICMVGDSAGGHLLGIYANICTSQEYAKKFDLKIPHSFIPRAVCLNCGIYKIFDECGNCLNPLSPELIGDLLPEECTAETRRLLNVSDYVTPAFPPAFIMTSRGDYLASQAPVLAGALENAGAYFEYKIYGDEKMPLYHVFHVNMRDAEGQKCNDEECDFLRRMIRKPSERRTERKQH